jgi:poly-gamma-glutamate capsule biosynthesis protein CapA/YwtB (metallophosphatase superfamily)
LPPDPATYLQSVATALAAPIVFGNLEGTITNATGSKCATPSSSCFAFRVPPAYGPIFRQNGFTVLNSANNHSHDFGPQGVSDTSAALRAAGVDQTGLPGQIALVAHGNTRVSFVGFAPYATTNSMLDFDRARRLIAEAKGESDVVVVYMHAGAEGAGAAHVLGGEETFLGEDRGNARAFAHAAIDAGANLVLASGPHILRGMEFYEGNLIAYSLGNFAGYRNIDISGDLHLSGVLRVTLDGSGAWQSGQFVSTLLDRDGHPTIDPNGAAAHFVAGLSTTDFGRAAATIAPDGSITPPT